VTETPEIAISSARAADLPGIKSLLMEAGLPTDGVDDHWRTFLVARQGDEIVGCAGCEAYPVAALIRSVAIRPGLRGQGVGRKLVRHLLDRLTSQGLREFYLLTTTAESYFEQRGFRRIDRDEVHPQLLASRELQDACPSTAVCMRLVMLT
jgi:amino-acid N-acetyltransferase